MLYETILTNKFGSELDYPSPVSGFLFKIPEGGKLIHRTTDPLNILARYSEIIFLPGREEYTKSTIESDVLRKKLYLKGLKCIVRKDWVEPPRKWPTVWFLNQGDIALEVVKPDFFDTNLSIFLFKDLPVLASVPCASEFAKFKKYTIHTPIYTPSQKPGAGVGAVNALENRELSGKRSDQEMDRLQRLVKDWKEQQKNVIRIT